MLRARPGCIENNTVYYEDQRLQNKDVRISYGRKGSVASELI
jgi:hypothetical protein